VSAGRRDKPVLAIVTDAWLPQVNGVVTTLEHTIRCLDAAGIQVEVIHPGEGFFTVPAPSYPSIRLAAFPWPGVYRALDRIVPDAIHISTEGPLGNAARRYCVTRKLRFTTSYHTQYPQYLRSRWPIPQRVSYAFLRHFHAAASRTMVATASMQAELEGHGFRNLVRWGRGVNADLFKPLPKGFLDLPRPISIFVGRLAVEKNIEAFLALDLPGSKVVVGDGPAAMQLRARYPQAVFTGLLKGSQLARYLADADVFVFPSRTDTFGVVMLEAMACGIPVAAFPTAGPLDVVRHGETGCLHEDLGIAVREALKLDGRRCREYALTQSWPAAAEQFASNLVAVLGDMDLIARGAEARQMSTMPTQLKPA